jgi:NADH:ubiquinone oxidoreductase subunit 6 (subunit J)
MNEMGRSINWFALSAGIIVLIVLVISLYLPWWRLTIGTNLINVNASPVNTNFNVLGTQFTIPLIWALNLISILTFTASGVVMLIYSLIPTNPYAKDLLSFSYKKPLYAVVGFVVGLVIIIFGVGYFGLNVPLMGSANLTLPSNWTMGATVSALVSGNFLLPFWLAIAGAALCIVARIYHGRLKTVQIKPETAAQPTLPSSA